MGRAGDGSKKARNEDRSFLSQDNSVFCRLRNAPARSKSDFCFVRTRVYGLPRRVVTCVTGTSYESSI